MVFQLLQDKICAWRDKEIKEFTLEGTVEHLAEEVQDLKENPYDPLSLADVGILWMSICEKAGFSMEDMANAIAAKQKVNESRLWGTADEKGIIRHIEETNM